MNVLTVIARSVLTTWQSIMKQSLLHPDKSKIGIRNDDDDDDDETK